MTTITRSELIASIQNTVESDDIRTKAIDAVNRLYIDEYTASFNDDQATFFDIVIHYDTLHEHDPREYSQQRLVVEGIRAFYF